MKNNKQLIIELSTQVESIASEELILRNPNFVGEKVTKEDTEKYLQVIQQEFVKLGVFYNKRNNTYDVTDSIVQELASQDIKNIYELSKAALSELSKPDSDIADTLDAVVEEICKVKGEEYGIYIYDENHDLIKLKDFVYNYMQRRSLYKILTVYTYM